ncbi:MAG: TonB family protein [Gemmatirosa sp.]
MLQHVRALPRPLPVPVAGTFVSLTAHVALVGALVASGGGSDGRSADDSVVVPSAGTSAGTGGERLHWVGIADGPGTGRARPEDRPPSAYVVPGRDGARRGALGGGPGGGRPTGSAFGEAIPHALPTPRAAPPPLPHVVLPDVEPIDAATLLVAGVVAAAPDRSRAVSRPADVTRMERLDASGDLLAAAGAVMLTSALAYAQVDALPIPLVGNPLPSYPPALVRSQVGGRVVVEFRIDSAGAVDLASLRVVQSTATLFTQAVRGVLPQLRFVPARLRQHAVGLTVRQPFVFRVVGRR